MDNAKTGGLIAARRKELGLTQKELAEHLHISDRTVSKWERGAGFPDISLLEPLADALELSIVDLIQGERQEEAVTEITVRSVAAAIGAHIRKTTRQQIITGLASTFLLVVSALFLLVIADSLGLLCRDIYLEIPVGVYENGVLAEQTTATIDGERHILTGEYSGRFAVDAIPETCAENVSAQICWDHFFEGHNVIRYYQPGQTWIYGPLSRTDLYISKDMTVFALQLDDGRVLSTSESLVPLAALDYYYAVNPTNVLHHIRTP